MSAAFEPHWVQRPGVQVERVHRVATVEAGVQALAEHPGARPVAGGTDLVVELARSQGSPVELIDVSQIEGFASIDFDEAADEFRLGGGVTHNDVVTDARLVDRALPLAQACLEIGSPQLRNRATIAGNLATASPANDSISALMALGAAVELSRFEAGQVHERRVPVAEMFIGPRRTVIGDDELISSIVVPAIAADQRGVWVKVGLRRAQAISVVHLGVWVEFAGPDGQVTDTRIALGSVAPTVVLSATARDELVGRPLTPEAVAAAAGAARAEVTPIDDGRASADYRRAAVETALGRALGAIAGDEQAAMWPHRVPTLRTVVTRPDSLAVGTVDDSTEVEVMINGQPETGRQAASATLLDWIRDRGLTGTKEGCAEGECGACTVLIDGQAAMACLVPAAQAAGCDITTAEGLAGDDALSAMQQSFVDHFAVQCGYCIPGFVVAASALAEELGAPTRDEIEFALAGNLCRCTGYYPIIDAVEAASGQGPRR